LAGYPVIDAETLRKKTKKTENTLNRDTGNLITKTGFPGQELSLLPPLFL
jgi:hypothetical protein